MNVGAVDLNPVQKMDVFHHNVIPTSQYPQRERYAKARLTNLGHLLETKYEIMLFKLNQITVF
jgi:hypothetical protein